MRAIQYLAPLLLLSACEAAAPDDSSVKQQLIAANAAYDKALLNGDAAALRRVYADDFQIISDDAEVHDKADQIQFMTTKVDLLQARSDDLKVAVLGPDAALVTGRFVGRYRMDGKENDFTERYTSVWVRDGKEWRIKHEHASLVPAPTGPAAG
jgi:ketosteroid isomerase-like protein